MKQNNNTITDVPGIKVGHIQNLEALTGCTVILTEAGATGGVDQRGGAPGTRETDALRPMHLVEKVHGVILSGGSAFGLDTASGVMKYLEEKNIGVNTGFGKVPIVPSAILFDLGIGKSMIRPDAQMGYEACQIATDNNCEQGNVGAGTGATVGKILGMKQAMKSGVGTASMEIGNGVIIGAIIAVNAFGDIVTPIGGEILAGARSMRSGLIKIGSPGRFADTMRVLKTLAGRSIMRFASKQNTVIGVVGTNAVLTKNEANKVAQMAHNGLAMTIRPAHTMFDGDTIFALATNRRKIDANIVGAFASEVVSKAIINGIMAAQSIPGFPAANEYP